MASRKRWSRPVDPRDYLEGKKYVDASNENAFNDSPAAFPINEAPAQAEPGYAARNARSREGLISSATSRALGPDATTEKQMEYIRKLEERNRLKRSVAEKERDDKAGDSAKEKGFSMHFSGANRDNVRSAPHATRTGRCRLKRERSAPQTRSVVPGFGHEAESNLSTATSLIAGSNSQLPLQSEDGIKNQQDLGGTSRSGSEMRDIKDKHSQQEMSPSAESFGNEHSDTCRGEDIDDTADDSGFYSDDFEDEARTEEEDEEEEEEGEEEKVILYREERGGKSGEGMEGGEQDIVDEEVIHGNENNGSNRDRAEEERVHGSRLGSSRATVHLTSTPRIKHQILSLASSTPAQFVPHMSVARSTQRPEDSAPPPPYVSSASPFIMSASKPEREDIFKRSMPFLKLAPANRDNEAKEIADAIARENEIAKTARKHVEGQESEANNVGKAQEPSKGFTPLLLSAHRPSVLPRPLSTVNPNQQVKEEPKSGNEEDVVLSLAQQLAKLDPEKRNQLLAELGLVKDTPTESQQSAVKKTEDVFPTDEDRDAETTGKKKGILSVSEDGPSLSTPVVLSERNDINANIQLKILSAKNGGRSISVARVEVVSNQGKLIDIAKENLQLLYGLRKDPVPVNHQLAKDLGNLIGRKEDKISARNTNVFMNSQGKGWTARLPEQGSLSLVLSVPRDQKPEYLRIWLLPDALSMGLVPRDIELLVDGLRAYLGEMPDISGAEKTDSYALLHLLPKKPVPQANDNLPWALVKQRVREKSDFNKKNRKETIGAEKTEKNLASSQNGISNNGVRQRPPPPPLPLSSSLGKGNEKAKPLKSGRDILLSSSRSESGMESMSAESNAYEKESSNASGSSDTSRSTEGRIENSATSKSILLSSSKYKTSSSTTTSSDVPAWLAELKGEQPSNPTSSSIIRDREMFGRDTQQSRSKEVNGGLLVLQDLIETQRKMQEEESQVESGSSHTERRNSKRISSTEPLLEVVSASAKDNDRGRTAIKPNLSVPDALSELLDGSESDNPAKRETRSVSDGLKGNPSHERRPEDMASGPSHKLRRRVSEEWTQLDFFEKTQRGRLATEEQTPFGDSQLPGHDSIKSLKQTGLALQPKPQLPSPYLSTDVSGSKVKRQEHEMGGIQQPFVNESSVVNSFCEDLLTVASSRRTAESTQSEEDLIVADRRVTGVVLGPEDTVPKEYVNIPELPSGETLSFELKSTWGDVHYIGLNGIELFDEKGDRITFADPKTSISAEPADINVLPEYGNDPRTVDKLLDDVCYTCDELHSWLAPYTSGQSNFVRIFIGKRKTLSMIRIWNYNKSRIHSYRGAKHIAIRLDGVCIFDGEIRKAPGAVGDPLECSELILFTMDPEILKVIEESDVEGQTRDDTQKCVAMAVSSMRSSERPLTAQDKNEPSDFEQKRADPRKEGENPMSIKGFLRTKPQTLKDAFAEIKEAEGRTHSATPDFLEAQQQVKERPRTAVASAALPMLSTRDMEQKRRKDNGLQPSTKLAALKEDHDEDSETKSGAQSLHSHRAAEVAVSVIEKELISLIEINIRSTWGDPHYVGLTGIAILDATLKPVNTASLGVIVDASPRDLASLGYPGDPRTIDKLLDAVNITLEDSHMWLIPYTKGAKVLDIALNGKVRTPSGGIILRKGLGECAFDYGQTVIRSRISGDFQQHLPHAHQPRSLRSIEFSFSSLALTDKFELPSLAPVGFIYKFVLRTTWGDSFYMGLNGIELYDNQGCQITVSSSQIFACPHSLRDISDHKMSTHDQRIPENLFLPLSSGHRRDPGGSWLAPIASTLSPFTDSSQNPDMSNLAIRTPSSEANCLWVVFDVPVSVSLVRIWNYAKTPSRGVRHCEIWVDDSLVISTELLPAPSLYAPRYQGIYREEPESGQFVMLSRAVVGLLSTLDPEGKQYQQQQFRQGESEVICINEGKVVENMERLSQPPDPMAFGVSRDISQRPTTALAKLRAV